MQPGPTSPRPLAKRVSVWALIVGAVTVLAALGVLAIEVHAPAASAAPSAARTPSHVRSSAAEPVRRTFVVSRKAPALRSVDPWAN